LTGTPTLIIPHLVDQPFWGERLHELGVGPAPIGRQRLTAASFAAALQDLAHNAKYRQHAQRIQAQVSSEDGLQQAYAFLQTHLQRADSKKRVNMPPITA
jgi:sterol 3beta-glucosyltransferase